MDIARTLVDAARNLTSSTSPDADRAFRLRLDERVADGIRRIAPVQLHDACDELDATPSPRTGEAVHATRKRLKHLRAIAARERAQVLLETLDALTERFAELPEASTAALRDRLERDRTIATASLTEGDGDIAATRTAISEVLVRTPAWTFEDDGFDAIRPGLKRIYRRGREGLRAAREDPSAENLHEWRKRVKDLWHATEIVCEAQPEQLGRIARRTHKLSGVLGDHHDLHVLRAYVTAHPQCFEDDAFQRALVAVIDRRSSRLGRKALARGRKLYDRKPKCFVRDIESGWRKRSAAAAKPTAG